MEFDEEVERTAVLGSRYADDIAIFTKSRAEAEKMLDRTRSILDDLSLSLNESKTLIAAPGDEFELLGLQVCGDNLDVSHSTAAKAMTKLGHYAHKLVLREQRGTISRERARIGASAAAIS